MNDNDEPIPASLADEAAKWVITMRGENAALLRREFEAWCAHSSAHRAAYDQMAVVLATSAVLKTAPAPVDRPAAPRRPWLWIGAAAAAAVVLAVAMSLQASTAPVASNSPLLTAVEIPLATTHGEIRTFRLADGSRVTLDAESNAAFRMTASQRGLRLDQGRARVVIARDTRPFALEAGSGAVVATEASVDIGYHRARTVEVRLLAGAASVQSAELRPATYFEIEGEPLAIGQPIAYASRNFGRRVREAGGAVSADWPAGWAEYRSIALGALIEQANRYADQPIVIDDPAIATMQVSGRFRLTDTDGFIARICDLFDLSATRRSDGYHLRRR